MTQPPNLPPRTSPPGTGGGQHMRRVELVISSLLRIGVAVSLLLLVVGTVVSFVRHPEYVKSPDTLPSFVKPGPALSHSLSELVAGLKVFPGQSIVTLGLLVLIVTPMMRVAVSIVAFFLERDWVYTLITSAVFCLLVLSLALGATE
jgi:uncharacterized membrane protein